VPAFPGRSGALALLGHGAIKFRRIEGDALVTQDIGDEVQRQSEGVVEAEGFLAWVSGTRLARRALGKLRQVVFQFAQT